MRVCNVASFPILAVVYGSGRFGEEYLVMPHETETVKGPLLLYVVGDADRYLMIDGQFVVTDNGRHEPDRGVLLVGPRRPASHQWMDQSGGSVGLRVRHFKDS